MRSKTPDNTNKRFLIRGSKDTRKSASHARRDYLVLPLNLPIQKLRPKVTCQPVADLLHTFGSQHGTLFISKRAVLVTLTRFHLLSLTASLCSLEGSLLLQLVPRAAALAINKIQVRAGFPSPF